MDLNQENKNASKDNNQKNAIDKWRNEGFWETVVDFRQIEAEGVPAHATLKALRKGYGKDREISSKTFLERAHRNGTNY